MVDTRPGCRQKKRESRGTYPSGRRHASDLAETGFEVEQLQLPPAFLPTGRPPRDSRPGSPLDGAAQRVTFPDGAAPPLDMIESYGVNPSP